ncbi:MAG TPA: hypothetical protein VK783_02100 [Bacteroidia bacterium]|jgi:hypothetical protein|nr:hypothetical protein [Bacteroidia bacterium]
MKFFARSSNTQGENVGIVMDMLWGTSFVLAIIAVAIVSIYHFSKRLFVIRKS